MWLHCVFSTKSQALCIFPTFKSAAVSYAVLFCLANVKQCFLGWLIDGEPSASLYILNDFYMFLFPWHLCFHFEGSWSFVVGCYRSHQLSWISLVLLHFVESSWATLIFPCSRHRTLLQCKPVFSAACLALEALSVLRKIWIATRNVATWKELPRSKRAQPSIVSPHRVQDPLPSSPFQHCLESCYTCTSSWDPNGLNRNRKKIPYSEGRTHKRSWKAWSSWYRADMNTKVKLVVRKSGWRIASWKTEELEMHLTSYCP